MNRFLADCTKASICATILMAATSLTGCQTSTYNSRMSNEVTGTYTNQGYSNQQVVYRSEPRPVYSHPQAMVSAQRPVPSSRSIEAMLTEAKAASNKFENDIRELKKKLGSKRLGARARKIISEDIQIKMDFINAVKIITGRLADKKIRLAYAEGLVRDIDLVRKIIDDRFIAEVDQEISRLNDLLRNSPMNSNKTKGKRSRG